MRARRERGERGAALVEAAIMLPVVLMLTFGAIEMGFAFNEQGTIRAATRSAARDLVARPKAAVSPVFPDTVEFYDIALDSLESSMKNLASGEPLYAIIFSERDVNRPTDECGTRPECMKFAWTGSAFTRALTDGDPWQAADRNACLTQTEEVVVRVAVDHPWITGIPFVPAVGSGVTLSAETVMALEPVSGAGC